MEKNAEVKDTTAKRVIILGGGFGGITAAQELDAHIEDGNQAKLDVILIDRGGTKTIGATHQFVLAGRKTLDEVTEHLSENSLKLQHVKVVVAQIKKLDLSKKKVITDKGGFDYDDLVISLGVDSHPEAVPGLNESSYDICSMKEVIAFKKELAHFKGGTIVVGASRTPYKCPPAPHELSFTTHDLLVEMGIREKTKLLFTTPFETAIPPANPGPVQAMMDECHIPCFYDWTMKEVNAQTKTITYTNGETIKFDLLLCTYPQRSPQVLLDIEGLCNEEGFIPVDGRTHRTKHPGVYAIGDHCATTVSFENDRKVSHPKAGGFAEMQGEYVAKAIIAGDGADWSRPPFEMTRGNKCVVEGHGGGGVWVEIDFFSNPKRPIFTVSDPDKGLVHTKIEWVDEHRQKWFK